MVIVAEIPRFARKDEPTALRTSTHHSTSSDLRRETFAEPLVLDSVAAGLSRLGLSSPRVSTLASRPRLCPARRTVGVLLADGRPAAPAHPAWPFRLRFGLAVVGSRVAAGATARRQSVGVAPVDVEVSAGLDFFADPAALLVCRERYFVDARVDNQRPYSRTPAPPMAACRQACCQCGAHDTLDLILRSISSASASTLVAP